MNTKGISGVASGTFLWITVSKEPQIFDEDLSAMLALFTCPNKNLMAERVLKFISKRSHRKYQVDTYSFK